MDGVVKDGGPAFPVIVPWGFVVAEPGMSLRDWFGGQAVAGVLAKMEGQATSYQEVGIMCAEASYAIADAMLAERSK